MSIKPDDLWCSHGIERGRHCSFCANEEAPRCKHGNAHYCGTCMEEKASKCEHGNVYYCGLCMLEEAAGRKQS